MGCVPANFHEGSRSEVLADYLFSGWGTVTPVRRQDDFGIDLYCTLTERTGQRAVVRDYFVVQVKSTDEPWQFHDRESVKWLVEYPQPLFLAWVDKQHGILRLYHVTPRFLVGALPPLPDRLVLTMEKDKDDGSFVQWKDGTEFSLSAPILRIKIADLLNDAEMRRLRNIFTEWVRIDRENCDLGRQGLLRFRMPASYKVNQMPESSIGEMGCAMPELSQLHPGILAAAECAECIGGQLGERGDRAAALFAALFVDHLYRTYPNIFKDQVRWRTRFPGSLGSIVCEGLNNILKRSKLNPYWYEGIDTVVKRLKSDSLVAAFLNDANAAQQSVHPEPPKQT
ncbi:MAG: hypothetical protein WB930_15075 [Syntrophobacteraceae bacterium]